MNTIKEVLSKNYSLKIISVLAAILFWMIVFNIDNEFMDKRISVPMEVVNEEVLENKGIVLLSEIQDTIELTVRGREGAFTDITPDNFKVVVDLATIESANTTKITINEPVFDIKDVYVSKFNRELDINVERLISREFPVTVRTVGQQAEGYDIISIEQSPETVELKGLESVINEIDVVEAVVDLNDIKEDISMERLCKVYDKRGTIIQSDGHLIVEDIRAKVDLRIGKRVNVIPVVTGSPAEDFYVVAKKSEPASVVLSGPVNLLDSLMEVFTVPVNVDGKDVSFAEKAGIDIPEGMRLVEPKGGVEVSVTLEQMTEREFRLTKNNVELIRANTDGSYYYEILDSSITTRVKGRREDVDNMRHGDIKLVADVYGLEDGLHGIPLKVYLPDKYSLVSVDSVTIKVERFGSVDIEPGSISVMNFNDEYEYTILRKTLKPRFRGMVATLSSLTQQNLKPRIDVDGLEPGIESLPLVMEYPSDVLLVENVYVDVRIDEKTPVETDNGGETEEI